MTGKFARGLSCSALAAVFTVSVASAQEQKQMSAEEKAAMEAWAKAATPGKQHKWLTSKAGKWDFAGKFWQAPGQAPESANGTSERTMILGGRVSSEKVASPGMMGQPFEGFGLTGFDNVTGEFWGTWSDSMGTGMMVSRGKCDDNGACTFSGEYVDPVTGKKKTTRMAVRDEGPDKEVHEFWDKTPDGKEFKSMELVYTRKN
jgi:hypothetical protein